MHPSCLGAILYNDIIIKFGYCTEIVQTNADTESKQYFINKVAALGLAIAQTGLSVNYAGIIHRMTK